MDSLFDAMVGPALRREPPIAGQPAELWSMPFEDRPPRTLVTPEMMQDTRYRDSQTGQPRPEAFHRGKAPHYTYEGSYGLRTDGTPKGVGYFGEITNIDDPKTYSTELAASGRFNGKERLFPLLIPGLNRDQINLLVNSEQLYTKENKQAFDAIHKKAWAFAQDRIRRKLSPFADPHEFYELPNE